MNRHHSSRSAPAGPGLPRRAPAWMALIVILGLGLAPVGCSDDREECRRAGDGELIWFMIPDHPGAVLDFTATVVEVILFENADPPIHQYLLRPTQGGDVTLQLQDLGFGFPIELGESYGFVIEMERAGGLVPANGIRISDDQGLRYLGVTDWLPNHSVFEDGYGDLGSDGEFEVFHVDGGCDPREEDTANYRVLENYQLEFLLDNRQRLKLWHGTEGKLGDWTVRAHKAITVKAKLPEYQQNQVSFSVWRSDVAG